MDEQQLQQQIVQLVQAAMQGDEQANQQIQQIMQAAQQGDQQAMQIAQMIQQVAQAMQQQQVQAAKFGAKLNYIKSLRGECPEGYEMKMFKQGGRVCKKCMKKEQGGDMPQAQKGMSVKDQFESYKCGGKKMKKAACGSKVQEAKCGGKTKRKVSKHAEGTEKGGIESSRKSKDRFYVGEPLNKDIDPGFIITPPSNPNYNPDPKFTIPYPTPSQLKRPWLQGIPKNPFGPIPQTENPIYYESDEEDGRRPVYIASRANGGSFIPFQNRGLN